MNSFANLSANLKLNIQDFSNKLKEASKQTRKFANNLNGEVVGGLKEINKQTWKWGLNLKSVSRVVSGIMISQTFYRAAQAIQSAASAVWEFTKQLETAQVAYSNLFGDVSLATEFINVLKDFAAKTPFSFTEAEAAAKRLLAYGIEYQNVMYVMQGVLSAASIQGDATKIESISRALGQIYTYGKLMTQEVRQLSEAGIPAYEILQEELGLTREQLANLGNEGIPAAEAINALVDGIQKRFGTAAEAAALTATGIISNIKDNATMLFANLFGPLSTFIKSALAELGQFLFYLRDISEIKGIGGVFEALFPEEMHAVLRQFVANFQALGMAAIRLVTALGGLLKPIISALIMLFNAFSPAITMVANVLAELVRMVTSNATAMKWLTGILAAAAAMWVLYTARAVAASVVQVVIIGMSKALAGLHTMLTFVLDHPFWALLLLLGGVLVGISGGFSDLGAKVNNFFKSLTQFNGVDPDKVLLPSQKDRANDLDKFNKRLEGTSDAMDDLADSTGKATKAAKGLLSFDEVFKLNEPDEGTGNGIDVDGLEDLFEGLDGLGSGYMPEVPDFSQYMDALKTNFLDQFKALWDDIKDNMTDIAGKAIGAAFGGLIGYLLGGKLGGILGGVIGMIVGYFWDMLADYFGLTPDQRVNAGIIGGVGAIIGTALGFIIGGPMGAKIGAAIGGFVGSFWGIFAEALGVIPEQHFATLASGIISYLGTFLSKLAIELGKCLVPTFADDVFVGFSKMVGFSLKDALIGSLKTGVIGAISGLVVGMLSNALTAWIAEELNLTEQDLKNASVGQTVGNIIGTIVGMFVGGPVGSIIGGAIGQLAGSVIGEFWDYMSNTLKGTIIGIGVGAPLGAIIGTIVGSIGGPLGAALGAVIGGAIGALVGLIIDYWEPISEFFTNVGEAIGTAVEWMGEDLNWLRTLFGGVGMVLAELFTTDYGSLFTNLGNTISGVGGRIMEALGPVGTFLTDVFNGLKTFFTDIGTAIGTVLYDIFSSFTTVFTDIWNAATTIWNDVLTAITTVVTQIWDTVSSIFYLVRDLIIVVLVNIWNAFITWFNPIKDEVVRIVTEIWTAVSTWFTNIYNTIAGWVTQIWTVVSTWFTNVYNTVAGWVKNVWTTVSTWFTNIYNTVAGWVKNIWSVVSTWFGNIYNTVKEWVSGVWSVITEYFSGIYNTVKDKVTSWYEAITGGISNIYNAFTDWISNLWNNVFGKLFGWIDSGIQGLRDFFNLGNEGEMNLKVNSDGTVSYGHAAGGIFNREHVARFSEDNKAEAIIPLEEETAMQPFVDAVANGLTASLAPILSNMNFSSSQSSQMQPLYVGTLIADERSLKELERKMEVIRMQEGRR